MEQESAGSVDRNGGQPTNGQSKSQVANENEEKNGWVYIPIHAKLRSPKSTWACLQSAVKCTLDAGRNP